MIDGPPRLTIVTPTFYPEPIGTPLYATDLARWFASRGWGVRVVTGQPFYPAFRRYPGYGRRRRHDRLDDIEILRLPTIVPRQGKAAWRAVNEANFALQGLARGLAQRRHRRSDAVLTITPGVPWAALVGRALTAKGGRHVVLVHDVQSGLAASTGMAGTGAVHRLIRASEQRSLERSDHIAVLTPEIGAVVADLGVRRPIDVTPLWATVRRPTEAQARRCSVQYSGNFGHKQGVGLLPDLAAALDGTARLLLRGEGGRFEAVRRAIEQRRPAITNVDFEAPVPLADLPWALATSPVHVVLQAPGSSEYAMPSKVVNALACGCAVVAMADERSPLRRLAQEVEGLDVVPVGDLAAVVERATHHLAHADPVAIAAFAAHHFDRDRCLEPLEALLLPRPPSGP